jgi:hypothetical protein
LIKLFFLKKLLLLPALIFAILAFGQPTGDFMAAKYTSLGAYSKSNADLYASVNNVAALAQLQSSAAAVYAEQRFMQNQLNFFIASVGIKTNSGGFALHSTYYGFGLYNQMKVSLGYGRHITNKLDVGAQFNYNRLNQANGYGSASSINASVGALLHISDKVHAGVTIHNPGGSKWNKLNVEKMPAQFILGIGYNVSDKLFISGEVVKQENLPTNINLGLQYQLVKQVVIRAGVATATNSFFGGVGFNFAKFRIDIAASYHPQLGLSPGTLLQYNFSNKPVQ